MRVLARIGYTLAGLALFAPAAALAGMPIPAPGPYNNGKASKASTAKPAGRLCGEGQRAKLMAEKGVSISPPPALPPGTPVRGGSCTRCGRPAMILAGPLKPSLYMPASGAGGMVSGAVAYDAPGRAVVGDEGINFESNGIDPAPIGLVQPRMASAMPAMQPGQGAPNGPTDPSVMAASATTSEPAGMAKANRPHVISHLLGISDIGRERGERRERRNRESHASIPYGQAPAQVNEVPASAVFGRGAR